MFIVNPHVGTKGGIMILNSIVTCLGEIGAALQTKVLALSGLIIETATEVVSIVLK